MQRPESDIAVPPMSGDNPSLFFFFFLKGQFNELYGMRQPFFLLESQPKVDSEREAES